MRLLAYWSSRLPAIDELQVGKTANELSQMEISRVYVECRQLQTTLE